MSTHKRIGLNDLETVGSMPPNRFSMRTYIPSIALEAEQGEKQNIHLFTKDAKTTHVQRLCDMIEAFPAAVKQSTT